VALQSLGKKSWEIKGIAAKNGCNDAAPLFHSLAVFE